MALPLISKRKSYTTKSITHGDIAKHVKFISWIRYTVRFNTDVKGKIQTNYSLLLYTLDYKLTR